MPVEDSLIKSADLARVREIEFANMFNYSVRKLVEALGITRQIPKTAGTVLKSFAATGTLESGIVEEGDVIPLSKYTVDEKSYKEITLKLWRRSVSTKAILEKGYDQAVDMVTEEMLHDVQKEIRKNFFTFLGTGTGSVTGKTFQDALAQSWGKLQTIFEDDDVQTVFFMNPTDVANYLSTANITMQTAFGMSYVQNFLGLGNVYFNSSVPAGKIYSTVANNVVLYYVKANDTDLSKAFNLTTDETGYIGIHEYSDYDRMTSNMTVISGIELFAEKTDGVVVATITPGE